MRNSKRWIVIISFCLVFALITQAMNFVLVPCSYVRTTIHQAETKPHDIVYLGTSHGLAGIDPVKVEEVSGMSGINLCFGGEYTRDSYYLLKDVCRNNKPKKVVYELDAGYWCTKENENGDFARLYNEMAWSPVKMEYMVDKMLPADFRTTLFLWYNYRKYFKSAVSNVQMRLSKEYQNYDTHLYDSEVQSYREGGFIYRNPCPPLMDPPKVWEEEKLQNEVVEYFEKISSFCEEKNIELIVVTTPVPNETLAEFETEYRAEYDYFQSYMEEQNVKYYNFNYMKTEGVDRNLSGFADYEGHMLGENAEKFSKILAEYM